MSSQNMNGVGFIGSILSSSGNDDTNGSDRCYSYKMSERCRDLFGMMMQISRLNGLGISSEKLIKSEVNH